MKNYSFLSVVFFIAAVTNTHAQPFVQMERTLGANTTDLLQSAWLTKDGGQLIGGYSLSHNSGEKSQHSRGGFDYWIIKLDEQGKITWDRTLGGNSNDLLFCLQQTTDGGYIFGGYSLSKKSGEKSENSRGQHDYWIVKTDSHGRKEWDKTIGGNYGDNLQSMQQTADGGYILGGFSNSNISGEKTENGRGWNDYWVVKISAEGKVQWDKTIGGDDNDYLQVIEQSSDGGYILGGYSSSNISGEKTEKSRGSFDYWVVKLNAAGKIEWDKTLGGNGYDNLRCLKQTAGGGYIFGGYSPSGVSGEKTQKSRGGYDFWLIKLTSKGRIVWDRTIGGSADDFLKGIQLTTDGGYVLGGDSYSYISGEKTENCLSNYSDYWVVKLDRDLKVQWDKTIGGIGPEFLSSINAYDDNNFALAGSSSSPASFDKSQPSRGGDDYWIVRLKNKTDNDIAKSTGKAAAVKMDDHVFAVYPNPAANELYIQTKGTAIISILNSTGKTMLTKTVTGKNPVQITQLHAGIYYVKNHDTGDIQKLVVIK